MVPGMAEPKVEVETDLYPTHSSTKNLKSQVQSSDKSFLWEGK